MPRPDKRRGLARLTSYLTGELSGNAVERRTDFSRCEWPVLLLQGFFASRRSTRVLEQRLRRDGFGVFSLNMGGLLDSLNTRSIDGLAERVRDKVERLYARYPRLGPLSIIGHSKGGLIGRYYVKRLGGDRRVKALITLATPHNGTPAAFVGCLAAGLVSQSVWQMTPMSPFIRRLKIGAFPKHVRFTSIYSKDDWVNPFPCCILEDNGLGNLFNLEVKGASHNDFLLRRSIYQLVRDELRRGLGLTIEAGAMTRGSLSLVRST